MSSELAAAEPGLRFPASPDVPAPPRLLSSPPPLPPPLQVRHGFAFLGDTREFFGIWFVNLVLSVLTLGVYSAWAKVRTERYFYGNTRLAGASFEYLAQPLPILYGRLIAYAVAIALGISAHFQILFLYWPLVLVVVLASPWLKQRSLRFRARYSAWRGLRFRFVEGVAEAYFAFLLQSAVKYATLGLLQPWSQMGQHDYMVRGHRFGGVRFVFQGDLGVYYIPWLISVGILVAGYVLMTVALFALIAAAISVGADAGTMGQAFMAPFAVGYLVLAAMLIFLRTRQTNLMWKFASLGPHRFESALRARDMIWIYFSNGIAIVFTLGLAVPWAMIRLARYRAARFAVWSWGGLDGFGSERSEHESAAGAELIDALDMGMDIGL